MKLSAFQECVGLVVAIVIVEHNRMAAKVMQEMNVPVSDFYSLLSPKLELAREDQFHWRPEAYKILADSVQHGGRD